MKNMPYADSTDIYIRMHTQVFFLANKLHDEVPYNQISAWELSYLYSPVSGVRCKVSPCSGAATV